VAVFGTGSALFSHRTPASAEASDGIRIPLSELLAARSKCLTGGVPDLPGQRLQAATAGRPLPAPPSGCLRTTPLKERGYESSNIDAFRSQAVNAICDTNSVRSWLERKRRRRFVVLGKFAVGRNRLQLHVLQYSFDTRFAADVRGQLSIPRHL
jgi:hypothetical protein